MYKKQLIALFCTKNSSNINSKDYFNLIYKSSPANSLYISLGILGTSFGLNLIMDHIAIPLAISLLGFGVKIFIFLFNE